MTPSPDSIPDVDPAEAEAASAGALLLDVREPNEWQAGHAPAAVHIPMMRLRAEDLPADRAIYCLCKSGVRSAAVVQAMLGAGFSAFNVAGGMDAWAAAGLPVVRDDGTPGTVV